MTYEQIFLIPLIIYYLTFSFLLMIFCIAFQLMIFIEVFINLCSSKNLVKFIILCLYFIQTYNNFLNHINFMDSRAFLEFLKHAHV